MKVMVLAHPLNGQGGSERILSTLSHALGDIIDFVFVYPDENASKECNLSYPYKGKYVEANLRWYEPTRNIFDKISKLLHRVQELRRIIREEDPDLILSNYIFLWHYLITGLKLCRLTTKRVILRFGTPVFAEINKRGKLYTMLMRLGMQHIDGVIANSQGVADELVKMLGVSPAKLNIINNPIPITEIITLSQEAVSDPPFGDNLPIILNVGRLSNEKNQALLIQAFQKVRAHIDAHLVMIGTGQGEGELRELVHTLSLEGSVHFFGWRGNPFKHMRQANIFVLSSNYEGFGNVIVEAMACGCPVISTDCPYGPSEILSGGKYGVLVPVGNEEGLAREIIRVLDDQKLRQILAKKGKQRATKFNVDTIANQYARMFHELAAQ